VIWGYLNFTLGALEVWGSIAQLNPLFAYFTRELEELVFWILNHTSYLPLGVTRESGKLELLRDSIVFKFLKPS
jgi:hypothetical protein